MDFYLNHAFLIKQLKGGLPLELSARELALYLDTHREDREALELYQAYQELYHKGVETYVQKYGPLNHTNRTEGDRYKWLDDPWPWDYQGNQD